LLHDSSVLLENDRFISKTFTMMIIFTANIQMTTIENRRFSVTLNQPSDYTSGCLGLSGELYVSSKHP
jgi:hypothetical protein